jgi:hypothetical protein
MFSFMFYVDDVKAEAKKRITAKSQNVNIQKSVLGLGRPFQQVLVLLRELLMLFYTHLAYAVPLALRASLSISVFKAQHHASRSNLLRALSTSTRAFAFNGGMVCPDAFPATSPTV